MDAASRVVTRLPLTELFDRAGPMPGRPISRLDRDEVSALMRTVTQLIVARLGQPLRWLTRLDGYQFWSQEVKPRFWPAERTHARLEDFPDAIAWSAIRWTDTPAGDLIVFESHH